MNKRKLLLMDAWVQLAAVVLVLVLVNALAARHFSRLDLTQDHVYTLSEASRALAGRLERGLCSSRSTSPRASRRPTTTTSACWWTSSKSSAPTPVA